MNVDVFEIDETAPPLVEAKFFHEKGFAWDSGFLGGVAEDGDGHFVFDGSAVSEVNENSVQFTVLLHPSPLVDEAFPDGVKLIGTGGDFFEPLPLDDRSFEKGSWGVRVVFEHFRRPVAVVHQVETTVKGRRIGLPGDLDRGNCVRRDAKFRVAAVGNDMLDRLGAHFVQFVGGDFETIGFALGELVAG